MKLADYAVKLIGCAIGCVAFRIVRFGARSWFFTTDEATEKITKWTIGLRDCGMRRRPFWLRRNGDRGQGAPTLVQASPDRAVGDCLGADVQPLEPATVDGDKLSGPECSEMISMEM
ncbi:hypothetical protein GCM10007857_64320 [Bradyrhizobium iriomotense]|uniref:Uncharacterized protein n=1 Tax=Bradyrhizobium iriomotense TaxID=441950 RepID=A0ABQ6B7G8_9BRAD|nr:hypothetical protein GCM10007857_64320 [Bradyrhizobium iriomotense]